MIPGGLAEQLSAYPGEVAAGSPTRICAKQRLLYRAPLNGSSPCLRMTAATSGVRSASMNTRPAAGGTDSTVTRAL